MNNEYFGSYEKNYVEITFKTKKSWIQIKMLICITSASTTYAKLAQGKGLKKCGQRKKKIFLPPCYLY